MVFVCVLLRSKTKIFKPWYARTLLDGKITLRDLYQLVILGEFDESKVLDIRTAQCEECLKWRVCYAAKKQSRAQMLQIERELDNLSCTCGACFQDLDDVEDSVFNSIFVNDKLSCDLPIEIPYYATFDDPLCFFCGGEVDLVIQEDCYPFCKVCKEKGYKPKNKIRRAFTAAKTN